MTTHGPSDGDAAGRGRDVAALFGRIEPELFDELCAAGGWSEPEGRARARAEWTTLAAYACVRALVAVFGFGAEGASAVDAFHDAVFGPANDEAAAARSRAARRYDAYGAIVRETGTDDPAAIARRLGAAAAAHMVGVSPGSAPDELVGALHDALYEAALDVARREA